MGVKIICAILVVLSVVVDARDLRVDVVKGKIQSKDTFTSDPYVSVSVCKQKQKTPTVSRAIHPEWNWSHTFKNVNDACRIKFHLYDEDLVSDDSIGEVEQTVGQWLQEGSGERTIFFGKGKSQVLFKVNWV